VRQALKSPGQGGRSLPVAETLCRALPIARRFGLTRLADITGLDRIGIPVYSAVVPRSPDILSVYNGKSIDPEGARCGAVMESIERQAATRPCVEPVWSSFRDLALGRPVLDPRSVNLPPRADYSESSEYAWIEGFDLLREEAVWVPARLAAYKAGEKLGRPAHVITCTNGLASGNLREEAVCHALCELIERDAWTLAELRCHWLPRARRQLIMTAQRAAEGPDDADSYECVNVEGAGAAEDLLRRFHCAGLSPLVRDISSDLGVPTFLATVHEELGPGSCMAHAGLGTHPDAQVACARALCEAAQSRVVDIQGVREDLAYADDPPRPWIIHSRRVAHLDPNSWYHHGSREQRPWRSVPTYECGDIADDIRWLLGRLAAAGVSRVIVVDLLPEETGVSVVRVIAPELESWSADRGRIGARAAAWWRAHV
jgi:ribosomal protein S12 methylthiotransferase accessory factor